MELRGLGSLLGFWYVCLSVGSRQCQGWRSSLGAGGQDFGFIAVAGKLDMAGWTVLTLRMKTMGGGR